LSEKLCPKCNGTGWVQEKKGEKEYVHKCDCQSLNILLSRSERANIPSLFAGAELKGYVPEKENPSQKKAKKIIRNFIEQYPAVDKGFLLQGPTGVGKTRLLCAIATELMKKDDKIDIYYVDWNDLVREMRTGEGHSTRDFSGINNWINKLTDVEVLLFDELAASKISQWVADYIYYLINKRYNDKKLTIFATNFYDKGTDGRETLSGRIGERLRSRLYEMAQVLEIRGVDFRQKNM
jgi:DNA replication protein DnaC